MKRPGDETGTSQPVGLARRSHAHGTRTLAAAPPTRPCRQAAGAEAERPTATAAASDNGSAPPITSASSGVWRPTFHFPGWYLFVRAPIPAWSRGRAALATGQSQASWHGCLMSWEYGRAREETNLVPSRPAPEEREVFRCEPSRASTSRVHIRIPRLFP